MHVSKTNIPVTVFPSSGSTVEGVSRADCDGFFDCSTCCVAFDEKLVAEFCYRTSLDWWIFLVRILSTITIALINLPLYAIGELSGVIAE